jgi:hypothetical protein
MRAEMLDVQSHPRRREGVLARPGKDTLILLDPHGGQYYTLDEVGARIWDLCDGSRAVSAIVAMIVEDYDAPAETIQADVLELLADLVSEKLLTNVA